MMFVELVGKGKGAIRKILGGGGSRSSGKATLGNKRTENPALCVEEARHKRPEGHLIQRPAPAVVPQVLLGTHAPKSLDSS